MPPPNQTKGTLFVETRFKMEGNNDTLRYAAMRRQTHTGCGRKKPPLVQCITNSSQHKQNKDSITPIVPQQSRRCVFASSLNTKKKTKNNERKKRKKRRHETSVFTTKMRSNYTHNDGRFTRHLVKLCASVVLSTPTNQNWTDSRSPLLCAGSSFVRTTAWAERGHERTSD